MSDNVARSSIRSRETTGICWSPRRKVVTLAPLSAVLEELRYILVRDARHVGAIRVHRQRHLKSIRPPVVAYSRCSRDRVQDGRDFSGDRAQRANILCFVERVDVGQPRDPQFNGVVDGIGLQLAHIDARARHALRNCGLKRSDQFRRVFFVVQFDDYLRVIQLLQLRRDRKPETRPASALKGRQRFQHRPRLPIFVRMLLPVFFRRGPHRVFHLGDRFVGHE